MGSLDHSTHKYTDSSHTDKCMKLHSISLTSRIIWNNRVSVDVVWREFDAQNAQTFSINLFLAPSSGCQLSKMACVSSLKKILQLAVETGFTVPKSDFSLHTPKRRVPGPQPFWDCYCTPNKNLHTFHSVPCFQFCSCFPCSPFFSNCVHLLFGQLSHDLNSLSLLGSEAKDRN